MMTRLLLALLALYKRWLSPALHAAGGGGCKFLPTCSEYAASAIAVHGPLRGTGLAALRLARCHPFSRGRFDPVPAPRASAANRTSRSQRPFPHEPIP